MSLGMTGKTLKKFKNALLNVAIVLIMLYVPLY